MSDTNQAAPDLRHPLEKACDATLRSLEKKHGVSIRIVHDRDSTTRPVVMLYKSGIGYVRIQFEAWSHDPNEQQIQNAIERCYAEMMLDANPQSKKLQFESGPDPESVQETRANRIFRLLTAREQQKPVDREAIVALCNEAFKAAGLGLRAIAD